MLEINRKVKYRFNVNKVEINNKVKYRFNVNKVEKRLKSINNQGPYLNNLKLSRRLVLRNNHICYPTASSIKLRSTYRITYF